LKQGISNLTGDCHKVLPAGQTLLEDAANLTFFDARSSGSGNQTVAQVAPSLAPYNPSGTLQSLVGGNNALTLNGPGSSISNIVLLGLQFFMDPAQGNNSDFSVGQGTVLVHELLHFATQLNDDKFVSQYGIQQQPYESASSAISRWLQNGCKN
jgi:hypothetical protein